MSENTQTTIGASDEHSLIHRKKGNWKVHCCYFMGGDTNPIEVEGTENGTMLGDLWCNSHFEADMMGSPISGNGSLGYDPVKKKYIFTWNDSTAPFLYLFEGDFDSESNVLDLAGENYDPVRQCSAIYRSRIEFKGENEHTVELNIEVPEGLPIKVLHYQFTRG
jgi:hypothetical protein